MLWSLPASRRKECPIMESHDLRPGDLVNEKEAASILRVSVSTMRNWRYHQSGPASFKLGKRLVRYTRQELARFAALPPPPEPAA